MAKVWLPASESFVQMVDELFDELLINRWCVRWQTQLEAQLKLIDYPDRYELQMETGKIDPKSLDLEAETDRIRVRTWLGRGTLREHTISFSEPIDVSSVKARWSKGVLTIVLPKRKNVHRIVVQSD